MKLTYLNVDVRVHNEREERLVGIFNERCRTYVRQWNDEFWHDGFVEQEFTHWRLLECSGLTDAMFFLEMIDEPISSIEIFQCLRDAAEGKRV